MSMISEEIISNTDLREERGGKWKESSSCQKQYFTLDKTNIPSSIDLIFRKSAYTTKAKFYLKYIYFIITELNENLKFSR